MVLKTVEKEIGVKRRVRLVMFPFSSFIKIVFLQLYLAIRESRRPSSVPWPAKVKTRGDDNRSDGQDSR